MIDLLSTFIWQVTIIHSLDHASSYEFLSKVVKGCCMSIRVPYKPYSDTEFWNKLSKDMKVPLDKIKQNPEQYLVTQADIENAYKMTEIWVPYIPDLINDKGSIRHISYAFEHKELIKAQKELLADLHKMSEESLAGGDKAQGL